MAKTLIGKSALVCGGSDGIGFSTAQELAQQGCEIILLGRSKEKLAEKITIIDSLNEKENQTYSINFADLQELDNISSKILESQAPCILINNCGGPSPGKLMLAELQDLEIAFRKHVLASQLLTKKLIPIMIKAKYGRVINIISTSVRQPIRNLGVSNTIRGAMASWSKTMSQELAETGITVNNILPGTTKTDRINKIIEANQKMQNISFEEAQNNMILEIPMRRFAEVEEISKAIAFLASPDASYITGVNLQVDGGKIKSI